MPFLPSLGPEACWHLTTGGCVLLHTQDTYEIRQSRAYDAERGMRQGRGYNSRWKNVLSCSVRDLLCKIPHFRKVEPAFMLANIMIEGAAKGNDGSRKTPTRILSMRDFELAVKRLRVRSAEIFLARNCSKTGFSGFSGAAASTTELVGGVDPRLARALHGVGRENDRGAS